MEIAETTLITKIPSEKFAEDENGGDEGDDTTTINGVGIDKTSIESIEQASKTSIEKTHTHTSISI